MGYSEAKCRLCGISFNIGRIRKAGEPRSDGWQSTGDSNTKYDEDDEDDEDDLDYVYESAEEDDYEFESDVELLGPLSEGDADVETNNDEDEYWPDHIIGNPPWGQIQGPVPGHDPEELLPLDTYKGEEKERGLHSPRPEFMYEHIAGPNCQDYQGYNGNLISVEEMRGCNTLQCLMWKNDDWQAEPDDMEFELSSRCFLTGISDHMPSRDVGGLIVIPARHGEKCPWADDVTWHHTLDMEYGMPFHPTCFDVFMHLSKLHFGRVDINGLMQWYKLEGEYEEVHNFPRAEGVHESGEQWWAHSRGLEYFAANPLFIPHLLPILRSAIHMEPSFNQQIGAFSVLESTLTSPGLSTDLFNTLPQELILDILFYLPSRSIANLRLASRAFRQLPISVFRTLLMDEMPFLWEVYDSSPPFYWSTFTASTLQAEKAARERIDKEVSFYRSIIEEEMPELHEMWCQALHQLIDERPDPRVECYARALKEEICELPRENTNWYEVYVGITRNWANLKGLWNRRRIWKDVEEVCTRIKRYYEEGKIVDL
ncbi:hypothetical protein OIDMADRAFT_102868 [Oidiodendron maius Zn]|uniref:F-box domain-containing protein n=1 Tax=Oidiodendron maius (strain Zn) TaxID=913774 RepID=A0A0C3CVN6_OIDMZ|nr:hypothetical protein OIDMADRAFT_102868 [Oidiodendron maius Zn]